LIIHAAKRFLFAELERVESNLEWIDEHYRAELAHEFTRRYRIICDLLESADTPDQALAAVDQRLADTQAFLGDLAGKGQMEQLRKRTRIDLDYLHGLRKRLKQSIDENIYPCALANVQRL